MYVCMHVWILLYMYVCMYECMHAYTRSLQLYCYTINIAFADNIFRSQ